MKVIAKIEDPSVDLVKAFLCGRNERTLEAYKADLADLKCFVGVGSLPHLAKLLLNSNQGQMNGLVLAYRGHLIERGLKPTTINRRLAAVRSLVKMGRLLGYTSGSVEIENLRVEPYRDTRGPGRENIQKVIEMLRGSQHTSRERDIAIIILLYSLALRASELVNLDVKDIDFGRSLVCVRGKGRSEKTTLTISEKAKEAPSAWLEKRGRHDGPLFLNYDRNKKSQNRLSRNGLFKLLRGLGKRAGLGVPLRPHGFRHTAITEAIKSTKHTDIVLNEVLQFSRHSSLRVLQIYADRERDVQGRISQAVGDQLG